MTLGGTQFAQWLVQTIFDLVDTMKNAKRPLHKGSYIIIALLMITAINTQANETDPKQSSEFDLPMNSINETNILKPMPIRELQSALSWCNRAVASAGHHAVDGKSISYQDVVVFSETGEYSCQDIIDLRFELPN